jgi:predicted lysophospholipase L1 biosynthesis ABC-type transport system permease subunit
VNGPADDVGSTREAPLPQAVADARVVPLLLAVAAMMELVGLKAALGPARMGRRVQAIEALRPDAQGIKVVLEPVLQPPLALQRQGVVADLHSIEPSVIIVAKDWSRPGDSRPVA